MDTVSSKWKYNGAKIINEPFRRNNSWIWYEFSFTKNWVSSLPKWCEATIKKMNKEKAGVISHKIIMLSETKTYDK